MQQPRNERRIRPAPRELEFSSASEIYKVVAFVIFNSHNAAMNNCACTTHTIRTCVRGLDVVTFPATIIKGENPIREGILLVDAHNSSCKRRFRCLRQMNDRQAPFSLIVVGAVPWWGPGRCVARQKTTIHSFPAALALMLSPLGTRQISYYKLFVPTRSGPLSPQSQL